jgi:hypothetical protein
LVPRKVLENLAKEYDLKLIENLNFHHFFEKFSKEDEFEKLSQVFHIYENIDFDLWFFFF